MKDWWPSTTDFFTRDTATRAALRARHRSTAEQRHASCRSAPHEYSLSAALDLRLNQHPRGWVCDGGHHNNLPSPKTSDARKGLARIRKFTTTFWNLPNKSRLESRRVVIKCEGEQRGDGGLWDILPVHGDLVVALKYV